METLMLLKQPAVLALIAICVTIIILAIYEICKAGHGKIVIYATLVVASILLSLLWLRCYKVGLFSENLSVSSRDKEFMVLREGFEKPKSTRSGRTGGRTRGRTKNRTKNRTRSRTRQ